MAQSLSSINFKLLANIKDFSTKMQNAERTLKKFGNKTKKIGRNMSRNFSAPLLGIAALSVAAWDKQSTAIAQVEAGLASTGNQVGKTSKELQKMASDLQNKTLFGDEDILKNATAQLLTFTNISGEQFGKTQQAALDLATRLGGDLKSATIQLGKALNDPVANLSALSRSGIQFTKDQKETIKTLLEAGRAADAQNLILEELSKQYGGSAEAAAKAGAGGLKQLSNSIGDLAEEFGKIITEALIPFTGYVKGLVLSFQGLSQSTKKTIVVVAAIVAAIGPLLIIIGFLSTGLAALVPVFAIVAGSFKTLTFLIASNPIGALLVGLSTLAAYWLISANNNSVANTELDKTATKAKTAAERLAEINDELERSGKTRFQTIREELEANLDPLKAQADDLKERISLLNEELDAGWSLETLNQIGKLGSEYKIISKQANGYIGALNKLTKKEQDQAKALKDSASAANELVSSYEEVETSTPTRTPILPSYSQLSGLDFQASAGEDPLNLTGLELRLENATNSVTKFFDKWGSSINMVGDLFGQMLDNKLQKLDNYHAKESERIQNSTLTEEEKAVAQEELDEQVAAKRAKLQRKQAKLEKSANLASAIMNGALAISATLGKSGFLGIPLSVIVGTLAAAQVATIAATPIPAFAEGGVVFGPTVGLMGEYSGARNNPEIIAPLSKLKSLLGDSMHGDNTFVPDVRISGDDILIVYDRAKRRKERR